MKKLLIALAIGLGLPFLALAAVNLPSTVNVGDILQGNTNGNLTRIATGTKGSLFNMGVNGNSPGWLNVGADGLCLKASSTSASGLAYSSCATGGTGLSNLNGMTGSTQTFSTTTTATGLNLNIISAADAHNWALSLQSGYSIPLTASTTEWGNKLSTTTAAATYEPILTKGNLTATSPLQFDNTRQVIGGAATVSVAAGYNIPLSASTTNWNNFYNTPSTRITAGNNLSWSGNTLNGISSSTIWGLFSASNPITYNSGTGAIGWTNSNNYITLGSLSGTSPINYNNGTGAISLTGIVPVANGGTGSSSLNTTLVSEGTNLYYTDARARGSISASASPITYDSSTGKIGFTNPGYISGNQTITLSGDITGSGATSITTSYNGIVPISKGGTATSTSPSASAVLLGNGTNYDYSVLPSCSNTTTSKLLYNNSTKQFSCGTDQTGSGGGATTTITSNVQSDGPNFIFATGTATGVGLNISGSGATITFTPTVSANYIIPLSASTTEWSGFYNTPSTRITAGSGLSWSGNTLSNAMASSTIIAGGTATHSPSITFATTTDTNILLSIVCGTSTCTFNPSWTGTLADGRIASATTWNNKLSAYNVISANGLISVSTTTALATLTASTSPTFTYVGATNASTTNLSVATNTYLTNVASCSNGVITGAGGLISCNAAAFLTATAANALYPTFSYASSSYATLWNLKAGSNITISTSSGVSVAVSSTPSFSTISVTGTTTLAATTTINGLTYYWPSTVSGTKILQNDGSGNLSWVADQTGGGGSLSGGTTGFVGIWASSTAMTTGTLRDNGTVSGVNATSSSYTFNIQGTSNVNPFNVSSSTGASLFSIDRKGQVTITGEGAAQLSIGSSTPNATLTVQGSSTQPTLDLLRVASSSNATYLQVASNGSTTISSLGAGPVYSTAGGSLYIGAGGSGITSLGGQTGSSQTFATSTSGGLNLFINSGSDIHTFTLQPASGYTVPLTASTTEWSTAYSWGNHAGLYPTFSYASSSYATLWNLQAGSNITISTSSGVSLAVSANPTFTKMTSTNASTTNLSIATDTYLTNVANCTNGIITGAGGKIACNGSAFLTSAITSLNGLTGASQTFATNTTATGLTQTITSSGTAHTWNLSLTSGYSIPLTASTTQWATSIINGLPARFSLASTTPSPYDGSTFSSGTSTVAIPGLPYAYKITEVWGATTRAGTGVVICGNGSSTSSPLALSTTVASTTSSILINAYQTAYCQIGSAASNPFGVYIGVKQLPQ